MKTKQFVNPRSPQFARSKSNYQLSQQAVRGLSNTLILTLGLTVTLLLSVSYIYLLIIVQSG
ncbi:hypothetical protein [Chamaesiphon sp. VAR_48_metabat_403]|uniref:hypothetical protein n=1 Tax=Chamaesiphon sp. VAR_48_metabat_403 TaxID=2964700 RepID=UPI00286E42E6|nr:hypothetical protein [Chamaesiphon sp. VAR_48_metabat_403]